MKRMRLLLEPERITWLPGVSRGELKIWTAVRLSFITDFMAWREEMKLRHKDKSAGKVVARIRSSESVVTTIAVNHAATL
jgi:hypothetical protein